MRIDTLDKQYQKSPDFPPDKADKWKYPEELDGWMLAHNGIRMELKQMGEALEAAQKRGPIQQWEVSCIQSFWKAHYMHVMSHHSNEDNLMVPYLKERVNYPEKLTADHTELVDKLNTIDSIVKGLGSSKEEETVDELLKEMKELTGIMLPHLKEEEEQGLPLARAYFEPEEIARVVQKILKDSPAVEMGSFIMCLGIDEFRNGFMKRHNIPGFVWFIQFKGCATAFDRQFTTPMEAVKSGVEPSSPKSSCTVQ